MNNNRTFKNVVIILIMLLSLTAMVFTSYNTIKSNTTTSNSTTKEKINDNKGNPPEKQSGEMVEPPEKPTENSNENDKAPSMGNDALDEEDMPSDEKENHQEVQTNTILSNKFYTIIGVEAFIFALCLSYLIESKLNRKDFQETFIDGDKITIFILTTIIITSITVFGIKTIASHIAVNNEPIIIEDSTNTKSNDFPHKPEQNNNEAVEANGNTTITEEKELTGNYESTNPDESVILVKDGGNAILNDINVIKSGDTTSNEQSDFYGINAGILVQNNSIATIKKAKITTSGKGSNAIFSTGENSKIYISDSIIETSGNNSARGLDATYGGSIEADNVTITTLGGSCATLATDRGEGIIKVSNSKLKTSGKGSPIIYSTGDISIDNTEGTASDSQMVVVEGKNSATVSNSYLIAAGTGNRSNIDKAGIMLYQSMSGDANEGKGIFTSTNSTLTIDNKSAVYKTAPLFFVTNTEAEINLTNTKLSYGSNILLSIAGTSEWGTSGSNGGIVTFNTNSQTMSGSIIVDNISKLDINMTKSSYRGAINTTNIAKEINLKIDKESKITLTADTYLTTFENGDKTNSNIDFNDHILYVDGIPINQK